MHGNPLTIHIFGIRIDEPVTMLTDLMIAVVCVFAFFRLNRIPERQKLHRFIQYYFICLGISTFLGGIIGHGFLYLFTPGWRLPGWLIGMIAVAMIEQASIELLRKSVTVRVILLLTWHNILILLAFTILTLVNLNFLTTVIYISYGMLIPVTGMHFYYYLKTGSRGAVLFLAAVGTALAGAIVYITGQGIHAWFNHLDLSHILLICSVYLFYRGARQYIHEPY